MTSISGQFAPNTPASSEAIAALVADVVPMELSSDYLAFLRRANGGEGFIGGRYVILWRAEDVIASNRDYQVGEFAPMLLLIGSNGGGEAYAFDRSRPGSRVFSVPFIGLDYREILSVSESFGSFVSPRQ